MYAKRKEGTWRWEEERVAERERKRERERDVPLLREPIRRLIESFVHG
jgi:hypothetical protein